MQHSERFILMNLFCCAYPRLWGRGQWFITWGAIGLIGWWRTISSHYASRASFHLFSYSLFIVCPWHHQSPGSTVYKHCFGWQKINWSANDVKSIKFLQSCILKPLFRLIHSLGNILLLRNRFFPPHSLLRARCISFNLSAVKGWPTSKIRRD